MSGFPHAQVPLKTAMEMIKHRLGMTDQDIAGELGVGVPAVRSWRTGRHVPLYRTIRPLQALAKRANVEISPESMVR